MAVIAAMHDLSGVGRCSLVAAISVLSAMGHTCYPVPTAVLSQQTGFEGYSYLDLTPEISAYLAGWRSLGVMPDMIYTGFLGGKAQMPLLTAYIGEHPYSTVLVDPVMGDYGEIYPCYDREYVDSMRSLVQAAHILTPNLTEFSLLTTGDPDHTLPQTDSGLLRLASEIGSVKLRHVVITGASMSGDTTENLLIDLKADEVRRLICKHTGVAYNGSGDLFASTLCGCIAGGIDMLRAVKIAGDFLERAAFSMAGLDADPRYGVRYEGHLMDLIRTYREEQPHAT